MKLKGGWRCQFRYAYGVPDHVGNAFFATSSPFQKGDLPCNLRTEGPVKHHYSQDPNNIERIQHITYSAFVCWQIQ